MNPKNYWILDLETGPFKKIQYDFQKMRGEGGGAGQRLFGIFPKIHSFLGHHPSLTFDIVPASPEARAECEAFCLN